MKKPVKKKTTTLSQQYAILNVTDTSDIDDLTEKRTPNH